MSRQKSSSQKPVQETRNLVKPRPPQKNWNTVWDEEVRRPFTNLPHMGEHPLKRSSTGMAELSHAHAWVRYFLQCTDLPGFTINMVEKMSEYLDTLDSLQSCDKCHSKALLWGYEFASLFPELRERGERMSQLAEKQDPERYRPDYPSFRLREVRREVHSWTRQGLCSEIGNEKP